MKIIGINGSPRRGWNCDSLVKKALEGAASVGAETEEIQLYAEPLKGCLECYACKRKDNKTGGLCAIRDNMRPLLEKCLNADAIVIASPNFFGYPSGMVRSFLERFLYPLSSYEIKDGKKVRVLGNRVIPAGIIFSMNVEPDKFEIFGYKQTLGMTQHNLEYVLGYAEEYDCFYTKQFTDYSKMAANMFDAEDRIKHHEEHFPIDEQNCFELGKRLIEKARELN
ncbi:MAG: flavodoxin family protein [Bacteroides sp.]|nr:flavodoxin family protein [Bacteroides sp.]